jgi:hypothetical protein
VVGGLVVSGLLFGVYLFVVIAPVARTVGFDALSYWGYPLANPYELTHGTMGSFVYSPVIARAFAPFSTVSWETFLVLWTSVLVASAIWLGGWRGDGWRRFGWLCALAFPPVAVELYHGNVHLLIAAAIALGFRWPIAWSFVLLTKVTPGVGLIWFLVRREWRSLGIALGATAVLVAISLIVDPAMWSQWLDRELLVSLRQPPSQPQIAVPLWLRLPAAAALVAWGARTDRRWTVVVAATIAMPVLWFASLSVLAALGTLGRPELEPRSAANLAGVAPRRAEAVP